MYKYVSMFCKVESQKYNQHFWLLTTSIKNEICLVQECWIISSDWHNLFPVMSKPQAKIFWRLYEGFSKTEKDVLIFEIFTFKVYIFAHDQT